MPTTSPLVAIRTPKSSRSHDDRGPLRRSTGLGGTPTPLSPVLLFRLTSLCVPGALPGFGAARWQPAERKVGGAELALIEGVRAWGLRLPSLADVPRQRWRSHTTSTGVPASGPDCG